MPEKNASSNVTQWLSYILGNVGTRNLVDIDLLFSVHIESNSGLGSAILDCFSGHKLPTVQLSH